MDRLAATPNMMRLAQNDKPVIRVCAYTRVKYKEYKHDLYIRCRVQNDILKVALFGAAFMRAGGNLPVYEVYVSRKERKFITYDRQHEKWLNAKLDRLEWPQYRWWEDMKVWADRQTRKTIRNYLGTQTGNCSDLLAFQLKIREINY